MDLVSDVLDPGDHDVWRLECTFPFLPLGGFRGRATIRLWVVLKSSLSLSCYLSFVPFSPQTLRPVHACWLSRLVLLPPSK
jgi:hypothetical protein